MKILFLILIYFFIFASCFVFLVPPFEANDEPDHLNYINFIAKNKSLPVQNIESLRVEKEGHQFPLYYILGAGVVYIFNSNSVGYNVIPNKNNVNFGGKENLVPVYNHVLNNIFNEKYDKILFFTLRFFQVFLSVLNLFFIFKIAEFYFFDLKWKLLTTFIAGAIPQFAFVSAYINNDAFANLISSLVIFSFLSFIQGKTVKSIIILSIVFAFGLITKKTIFFFIPAIFFLIVIMMLRKKINLKEVAFLMGFVAISSLLIASWFFIRNINLYNDVFLTQVEMKTVPYYVDAKSLFSFYFIYPFIPGLFGSLWGVFGWMNVALPFFIYILLFLFCAVMFISVAKNVSMQKIMNEKILFAVSCIILCIAGVVFYNLSYSQHQGRFLFPVISFISIFMVYGVKFLTEKFERENLIMILVISFFVFVDIVSIFTLYSFYNNLSVYL